MINCHPPLEKTIKSYNVRKNNIIIYLGFRNNILNISGKSCEMHALAESHVEEGSCQVS